jgi:hypothetical protein
LREINTISTVKMMNSTIFRKSISEVGLVK